jgi:glycerol-3-phosphate O-acyltransferase 3/4
MIGQAQGGFMGLMQKAMSRSEHHIWFQRSEIKDRMAVTQRLREHIEDVNKLPVLIFPEGTCINNTSIMMFKKGSFEVGGTIYPVAIKYDSRFADAFWNSSKETLLRHFLNVLTSWALVVDVWYLPAEHKRSDETVLEFTNRVKADIARQGGLVDLDWDGQLKREKLKPSFLHEQQAKYSRRIRRINHELGDEMPGNKDE